MTFVNEKSVGKFSIYVTAFLIFATIFKAMFYFITPYGTALFVQNFLVIGINVLLWWHSSWSSISLSSLEVTKQNIRVPSWTVSGNGLLLLNTVTNVQFSVLPGLFYTDCWLHHLPEHCQRLGCSFSHNGFCCHYNRDLHRYTPGHRNLAVQKCSRCE